MEENKVESLVFQEYEDECAYAKLQGPTLLKFIKKKNVFVGREAPIVDYNQDEEVIFISDSNKISRKHLKIFWDHVRGEWYAKNLSKNPVIIKTKYFKNTDAAIQISPVSAIKIDNLEFYFIQARDEDINSI
jgi:hypothetical protein